MFLCFFELGLLTKYTLVKIKTVATIFTVVYKHNEDYLKEIYYMVSDIIGKHQHCFVPSDRAHHIEKFKFYKDGEEQFLEHSPKYGKSTQRTFFELNEL